jgi:hypothetical protein
MLAAAAVSRALSGEALTRWAPLSLLPWTCTSACERGAAASANAVAQHRVCAGFAEALIAQSASTPQRQKWLSLANFKDIIFVFVAVNHCI